MSEAHKGALISPELSALVHWTIGRATASEPDDAVQIGMGLVDEIQKELNAKFRAGVSAVRRTQPVDSITDSAIPSFRPVGSDLTEREAYANGAAL